MCRLLAVVRSEPAPMDRHLRSFSSIAETSKEYQGHGWGCAWRQDERWVVYRDIRPIWESELPDIPSTACFVAHARSAYRNEGISVENNMPFAEGEDVFLFNGELQGVRIRESGRIGAEKVFHYLRRFRHLGWERALEKGSRIIERRSQYLRAMNIIVSDGSAVFVRSRFNEDPEYFTMHYRRDPGGGEIVVCSAPLSNGADWRAIPEGERVRFP